MSILEQKFESVIITDIDSTGTSFELTLKNKSLKELEAFFEEEYVKEIRLINPVKPQETFEVSTSMGVDTRPAKTLSIAGFWVLLDPKIDMYYLQKIRRFLAELEN